MHALRGSRGNTRALRFGPATPSISPIPAAGVGNREPETACLPSLKAQPAGTKVLARHLTRSFAEDGRRDWEAATGTALSNHGCGETHSWGTRSVRRPDLGTTPDIEHHLDSGTDAGSTSISTGFIPAQASEAVQVSPGFLLSGSAPAISDGRPTGISSKSSPHHALISSGETPKKSPQLHCRPAAWLARLYAPWLCGSAPDTAIDQIELAASAVALLHVRDRGSLYEVRCTCTPAYRRVPGEVKTGSGAEVIVDFCIWHKPDAGASRNYPGPDCGWQTIADIVLLFDTGKRSSTRVDKLRPFMPSADAGRRVVVAPIKLVQCCAPRVWSGVGHRFLARLIRRRPCHLGESAKTIEIPGTSHRHELRTRQEHAQMVFPSGPCPQASRIGPASVLIPAHPYEVQSTASQRENYWLWSRIPQLHEQLPIAMSTGAIPPQTRARSIGPPFLRCCITISVGKLILAETLPRKQHGAAPCFGHLARMTGVIRPSERGPVRATRAWYCSAGLTCSRHPVPDIYSLSHSLCHP